VPSGSVIGPAQLPNQPGQPPDVAADVSPTQNVELTNFGLWIYDKSGNPQPVDTFGDTVETTNQFWCGVTGANGQFLPGCPVINPEILTDTQIAWDPFEQRWLASTMLRNGPTGVLFFAMSTSTTAADTGLNWQRYSLPLCTGGGSPDQPILGYSSSWVAIDTLCLQPSSADTLYLIPQSAIASPPPTLGPLNPAAPFQIARPSRDVSGPTSNYPNLILASSVVPASSPPYLTFASVNSSGVITALSPPNSPPLGENDASFALAPGQQPGCTTAASNCEIDLGDARVQQVIIQYDKNDGNHYMFTSFATAVCPGGTCGTTDQSLTFIEQLENPGSVNTPMVNFSGVYPSVAVDPDLDVYQNVTSFSPYQAPYLDWFLVKGPIQNTQILNAGTVSTSSGSYTGTLSCGGTTSQQRWGDFTSAMWDPSITSQTGLSGGLWTVQEFTNGGPDQSTEWFTLNEPLPFSVGYGRALTTCPNGSGNPCTMNIKAPSGSVGGDVLLVSLAVGQYQSARPTAPSGWTFLPFSNHSGSKEINFSDSCGFRDSGWLLAHVYGPYPNDKGSYNFTFTEQAYSTCDGEEYADMAGLIMAYRGAGYNFGNYTSWGYGFTSNVGTITANAESPPGESELLTLFLGPGPAGKVTFSSPSGSPPLTAESNLTTTIPLIAADAGVPVPNVTYGPYTTRDGYSGDALAWQASVSKN
jgi:hypothetical protein